jgi:hypothetical protein
MIRHALALLCVFVVGCSLLGIGPGPTLDQLNDEYAALAGDKTDALRSGADVRPVETKLADLARRAAQSAQATSPNDPQSAVAMYRTATLAAWQAGEAGESELLGISGDGTAACTRLPQGDRSRPGDCSMIRLAAIVAVGDDLQRDLRGVRAKLDGLQTAHAQQCDALAAAERAACLGQPARLPATDRAPVEQIFNGFAQQFADASELRRSMDSLGVEQTLKDAADDNRYVLYCSAVTAWDCLADVDGIPDDQIRQFTNRKEAMKHDLEPRFQTIDCRTQAPASLTLGAAAPAPQ